LGVVGHSLIYGTSITQLIELTPILIFNPHTHTHRVEEEDYTTRIIHYFSTGILTLPEGLTLRAYLAQKLNCDPMRITKKYAGASCLGKRVYHLSDRGENSGSDFERAKIELAHKEKVFRAR